MFVKDGLKNPENGYPQLRIPHAKRERGVVRESMFSEACSRISNVWHRILENIYEKNYLLNSASNKI
jgi:hypothetical protein